MRVVVKLEAFRYRKASESLVPLHLVLWCQFYGALRDYVAIVLDRSHVVEKPVDLFEVDPHD